jgi:hypothetical protein
MVLKMEMTRRSKLFSESVIQVTLQKRSPIAMLLQTIFERVSGTGSTAGTGI